MIRNLRALSVALLATLALAASAHAVGEGRVLGTVVDQNGKPIPNLKVSLTLPGSDYKLERKTDAQGKFSLLVLDATKEYLLRMELEGFSPFEETIKPKPGDTLRLDYTLTAQQAAPEPTGPSADEIKALEGKNEAIAAFNEGVIALKGGDLNSAAAKFEAAVKVDPALAPAYGALAEVYAELGKNAEALAAAERYLELEPGNVRGLRVRYDAAKALGDKEKTGQALQALAAVDKSRDTAIRIYNLGAESSRAGDRDAAVAHLKQAIEIDPTLDQAYTALGQVLIVKKDFKQAAEVMEKLLARTPQNIEALTIRYEALNAVGDKAGAKAALEAMKSVQASQNPDELFKQGVAQYNAGNPEGAIQTLAQAVTADPKHAKAHFMLGLAYASSNGAKAKEHLQKFLALAPNDPDAATAKEMLTFIK